MNSLMISIGIILLAIILVLGILNIREYYDSRDSEYDRYMRRQAGQEKQNQRKISNQSREEVTRSRRLNQERGYTQTCKDVFSDAMPTSSTLDDSDKKPILKAFLSVLIVCAVIAFVIGIPAGVILSTSNHSDEYTYDTTFYENGILETEKKYLDGMLVQETKYYKNGNMKRDTSYEDSYFYSMMYRKDGSLSRIEESVNDGHERWIYYYNQTGDELVKEEYYEDQILMSKSEYDEDGFVSHQIDYYSNGKIYSESFLDQNGECISTTVYDEAGKVIEEDENQDIDIPGQRVYNEETAEAMGLYYSRQFDTTDYGLVEGYRIYIMTDEDVEDNAFYLEMFFEADNSLKFFLLDYCDLELQYAPGENEPDPDDFINSLKYLEYGYWDDVKSITFSKDADGIYDGIIMR